MNALAQQRRVLSLPRMWTEDQGRIQCEKPLQVQHSCKDGSVQKVPDLRWQAATLQEAYGVYLSQV